MGRFASPAKQAASVMKLIQGKEIKSLGTVRDYENALTQVAKYLSETKAGSLRDLTPETAKSYLEMRASKVGKKTLDCERQAIQKMMQCVTRQLAPKERLRVIESTYTGGRGLAQQSRLYSRAQVDRIKAHQSPKNAMATELGYSYGLRAHELLTLRRHTDREQSPREKTDFENKFATSTATAKEVRENTIGFTVVGKGGLVREIRMSIEHARELSKFACVDRSQGRPIKSTVTVIDRGIRYETHYLIGGGQAWSQSFTEASKKALGWSQGAHGLRHSYAQNRIAELRKIMPAAKADEIVSQELGHFRASITEAYKR